MRKATFLAEDIFTISGVLSNDECDQTIAWAERIGFDSAPVTTHRGPIHRPDIRNNTRVMVDNIPLSNLLWDRIAHCIPDREHVQPVGLNERLRVYRYEPGQRFAPHRDGHYKRPNGECSALTCIVYLNDDFSGGETRFIHGVCIRPQRGLALLFHHPIIHEGCEVLQGRKYALRTDVMFTTR